MHEKLNLPYKFTSLEDGKSMRGMASHDHPLSYIADENEGKDCGMVVVLQQNNSHYHIYIAGAKRLGVLAATMVLWDPRCLIKVLEKRRHIKGSFQIVFGAMVNFRQEKVCSIDLDSLKVLPVQDK